MVCLFYSLEEAGCENSYVFLDWNNYMWYVKIKEHTFDFGDWWKVVYSIDKGRENTKNSGSIGIKESVCRSVKDNGRRVLRSHDFSFLLIFPILSTIPNLLLAFSVHLMNRYFPDFWYSHVTEKKTSEERNAICEKSRISYGSKVHDGNWWRNGWLSIWIVITLFFVDGYTKIRI